MNGNDSLNLSPTSVKFNNFNNEKSNENGAVHLPRTSSTSTNHQTSPEGAKQKFVMAVLLIGILLLICLTLGFGIANLKVGTSSVQSSKDVYPKSCKEAMKLGMSSGVTTIQPPQSTAFDVGTNGTSPVQSSKDIYPKSCKEAMKLGMSSGVIKIQPPQSTAFDVYCDMSAAGGGWTMIASIHEDDTEGECSSGDNWSLIQKGKNNWNNLYTFGDVNAATSSDYKSQAYYNVPATDLMIWHVPNDVLLSEISSQAFFKYHTTSGFLRNYGSSIQSLYSSHLPLKRFVIKDLSPKLLHCFKYDFNFTRPLFARYLSPGGKFDDEVSIKINDRPFVKLQEGLPNNLSSGIDISVETSSKPYVMLAWLSNEDGRISSLTIKVNRSDTTRPRSFYTSTSTSGGYTFQYKYTCVSYRRVCKILFVVRNSQAWNYDRPRVDIDDNDPSNATLRLTRNVKHVLVGYAVVSAYHQYGRISSKSLLAALGNLTSCFSKIDLSKMKTRSSVSTPVTFIKGSMSDYKGDVTPGFLQFRTYDSFGNPFALCPGVRPNDKADPSLYCVGGNVADTYYGTGCGDFAAWYKLDEHYRERGKGIKGFFGTSVTDLTSTLLLFARDSS